MNLLQNNLVYIEIVNETVNRDHAISTPQHQT